MATEEISGGGSHGRDVQLTTNMPGEAQMIDCSTISIPNLITVGFGTGIKSGVELRKRLLNLGDDNIIRGQTIQPIIEGGAIDRDTLWNAKIGDLPHGMNPRICTAGPDALDGIVLDHLLDRIS